MNDPQLEATDFATKLLRSENFLSLACPIGAGNSWRIQYRDATVHVHLLLRAMVAAQDFAGAARALATLHRLHCRFDPDIYRYTVSLLRLSGDHQVSSLDMSSALRRVLILLLYQFRSVCLVDGASGTTSYTELLGDSIASCNSY